MKINKKNTKANLSIKEIPDGHLFYATHSKAYAVRLRDNYVYITGPDAEAFGSYAVHSVWSTSGFDVESIEVVDCGRISSFDEITLE